MNENQEKLQNNPELGTGPREKIIEKIEKISEKNIETAEELSSRDIETRTEKVRQEALEKSASIESITKKIDVYTDSSSIKKGRISKKQLDKSYSQTMHDVQNELPNGSRIFSKIIHNNTVEKTSELLGRTIARPNAILAGAILAFILTLLTYTVAKTIGYALSGFETIAAFIIGWIIGITYDYLRVLFTGKKY
ncbi:MAG: hypothetical protein WCK26_02540 [Candidatus Saccharibacteria bacterium]